MMYNYLFFIVLLNTIASFYVNANIDNFGIDDWKAGDVEIWVKGLKIKIDLPKDFVAKLQESGIDGGIEALTLKDEQLVKLGLQKDSIAKYLKASKDKLIDVSANPVDIFEWRVAHRRLCDYWILPLIMSPHFALPWARFFSEQHSPVIDKVNDEIDGTSLPVFWLQWFVCPSYPLWQMAKKFQSTSSYVDNVLQTFLALTCIEEFLFFVVIFFFVMLNKIETVLKIVALLGGKLLLTLGGALFVYFQFYVLYFVNSLFGNFVHDFNFYLILYVGFPLAICLKTRTIFSLITGKSKRD